MIYIIDTETTGNEPAEVIELAWMRLGTTTSFVQCFKANKPSAFGALATHHILDSEIADKAPSSEAALPKDAQYIIGHNIDYDWAALGKPPVKRICTLAISRALFTDSDSHSLGAMAYRLMPQEKARMMLKDAHSAEADVLICAAVLNRLQPQAVVMPPEDLWKFSESCRIPKIMPFGKHRGTPIVDLPRDYIRWMLRQPDMDEYVLKAVRGVK